MHSSVGDTKNRIIVLLKRFKPHKRKHAHKEQRTNQRHANTMCSENKSVWERVEIHEEIRWWILS